MGQLFRTVSSLAAVAGLLGCATPTPVPVLAVLHYQHVANAHQIRFTNPIALSAALYPVGFLTPVGRAGFWAVFLICNVDVSPRAERGFHYNVDQLQVRYDGHNYSGLPPYSLRYQDQIDLNNEGDTAPIRDALAAELHEGPPEQILQPGYYPDLNYRFAVFIPKGLPHYTGEQLALRYQGQPVALVGNGKPPSDLPAVGGSAAGVAAACLPLP